MNNTHCDTRVALFWNTSANYYSFVTFTTSVVIAAMSPVTMTGNLLVALAIRRNESHRSPSYRLLGVLSLEYFILGLIFQPLYAAKEIVSVLRQSFLTKKSFVFYNHLIFGGFGTYIIAVTILTITYMAIERWLYMTRRSWMDSGRVGPRTLRPYSISTHTTDSVPYIAYFNRNLLPNNKYGNYLPAGGSFAF